jgi:AraC-like DNA-binding protein
VPGVDLLRARFLTHRYSRHAHETFATGMSPFALLRAFRDDTGLPPHAYLNQLRVRLARRLLDRGLAPALVAAEAGFAGQAHLTRHFKRVVGVPPGAYQRERGSRPTTLTAT